MMRKGFTLAELLIALAILGVIATFTIPKVLQNQADSQRAAVLKEAYAALSEVTYTGVLKGELSSSNYRPYFQSHLNAVIVCSNAGTQGCWPGATTAAANVSNVPGFLLHNGAMITDFEATATGDTVWVDWNGTKGPNQNCVDQVPFVVAHTSGTYNGGTIQAGRVYMWTIALFPSGGASVCSDATYSDLFTN